MDGSISVTKATGATGDRASGLPAVPDCAPRANRGIKHQLGARADPPPDPGPMRCLSLFHWPCGPLHPRARARATHPITGHPSNLSISCQKCRLALPLSLLHRLGQAAMPSCRVGSLTPSPLAPLTVIEIRNCTPATRALHRSGNRISQLPGNRIALSRASWLVGAVSREPWGQAPAVSCIVQRAAHVRPALALRLRRQR